MYFDTAPKTRKEDMFEMDYLIDSLANSMGEKDVRMAVIKGLRRTGKTSLLNVSLNQTKQKHIKIDVRESPYYDRKEFMLYLAEKIKGVVGERAFQKLLKHISGVKVSYKDVGATLYIEKEKNLLMLFEQLNEYLKTKDETLIIAFDEIQLLSKIKFEYALSAVYDNYRNIKMVITGSEMGLVDKFLGIKDSSSPLFGRAHIEMETKRLSGEQINNFLMLGSKQAKTVITAKEIKEAIEMLDGIIGWATYYGWLRSKSIAHNKALSKVISEGSELTKRELDKFLSNRKKAVYLKILKWIAKGYNSWTTLKAQFVKNGRKVSDSQLNLYLTELIDYSFIEKINKTYIITDPLLIRAL
ncbi:MAG: ATP-binding protein [Nanoarchaeota archaeon]|nr:ATP-binding protein [Nanoarchaeota archaeon]